MELTQSYVNYVPSNVRERYDVVETRSAASYLSASDPEAFADLVHVLTTFNVTFEDLTAPGGSKSTLAARLDTQFRERGWREVRHEIEITSTLTIKPYRLAGETVDDVTKSTVGGAGHLVDNFKGRVALDVEWNAKDGNLDRDLSNFRALHEAGVIDLGVIITRSHIRIKYAANYLAAAAQLPPNTDKQGKPRLRFSTSTTTNIEKLTPRLLRGDGGGCPVLGMAITDRCYLAGPADPELPKPDDEALAVVAGQDEHEADDELDH